VLQADKGADLDFLVGNRGAGIPRGIALRESTATASQRVAGMRQNVTWAKVAQRPTK
jgi:hypothetical protein